MYELATCNSRLINREPVLQVVKRLDKRLGGNEGIFLRAFNIETSWIAGLKAQININRHVWEASNKVIANQT